MELLIVRLDVWGSLDGRFGVSDVSQNARWVRLIDFWVM